MNTKAMKFDQGKPPIDLIDQGIILELAKVLGYGAEKYEAHNWRIGLPISRYYSALQRHMLAFNDGETIDPESGLSHLGHAACNLMFMICILNKKPHLDDRYRNKELEDFIEKSKRGMIRPDDFADAARYFVNNGKFDDDELGGHGDGGFQL